MKIISLFILVFVSIYSYSQSLTSKEIAAYVKTIDSLKQHKALQKIKYRNMSFCGGSLTGYYYGNHLVYVNALYSAELGFTEQKIYLKDTVPYKLSYRQYFAEWDKYNEKYPNKELDEKLMTYSDTTYQISFTNPIKISKYSKKKHINNNIDDKLLKHIRNCVFTMCKELEDEKKH